MSKELNEVQKIIANTYSCADFNDVRNMYEVEQTGDPLFVFLMTEAQDANKLPQFMGTLKEACDQLEGLYYNLNESLQQRKHG